MHERRKEEQEKGDLTGQTVGDFSADFPDWDNPEDFDEGAPEGYYDDDYDEEDDSYIPTPDDPDYDLSEVHGYSDWDAPRQRQPFPQWVVVVAAFVLIIAILLPILIRVS